MPLATSREMLQNAMQGGYAVAAFNIENMEMAQAVVAAAEALGAPVMLQTTPSTLKYAAPEVFAGLVGALAKAARVPVCLHLDHGDSPALALRALQAGYTSVMFDGSPLPFEENIAQSAQVVQAAAVLGMPVEAELGRVGGKEDETDGGEGGYTAPGQAQEFLWRTGVDSLAVAIGMAHGVYKTPPRLDVRRLEAIRQTTEAVLVLHGASGLPDADVKACVARGISKVNFATELRIAYTRGVRAALESAGVYDPKVYGRAGREAVEETVRQKILLCGCAGKA